MSELLANRLLGLLAQSVGGLTNDRLYRDLQKQFPDLDRRQFQVLLKHLISEGRVAYTLRHGATRVALGGYRPERISERIYLSTSDFSDLLPPQAVCVRMIGGVAFGSGDHPTTCLMLRALDRLLGDMATGARAMHILDVGTGNGVLAIAALMLGARRAVAVDLDPQACHEALINARHNAVAPRCAVVAGTVDALAPGGFDLLMANLRPPTLAALMPKFETLVQPTGLLMLSGFREGEKEQVVQLLPHGMRVVHQDQDRDWAMLVAGRVAVAFSPFPGG